MAVVFKNLSVWQRIAPWFRGFDGPLAFAVFLLACAGMLTMYSSGFDQGTRFEDHGREQKITGLKSPHRNLSTNMRHFHQKV